MPNLASEVEEQPGRAGALPPPGGVTHLSAFPGRFTEPAREAPGLVEKEDRKGLVQIKGENKGGLVLKSWLCSSDNERF